MITVKLFETSRSCWRIHPREEYKNPTVDVIEKNDIYRGWNPLKSVELTR